MFYEIAGEEERKDLNYVKKAQRKVIDRLKGAVRLHIQVRRIYSHQKQIEQHRQDVSNQHH